MSCQVIAAPARTCPKLSAPVLALVQSLPVQAQPNRRQVWSNQDCTESTQNLADKMAGGCRAVINRTTWRWGLVSPEQRVGGPKPEKRARLSARCAGQATPTIATGQAFHGENIQSAASQKAIRNMGGSLLGSIPNPSVSEPDCGC